MENTTERDDHCVFHEAAITFLATEELDPVAKLISSLLRPPENQDAEAKISRNTFYRFCSTNFPNSMSLKLLQIYASPDKTGYDDNIRQIAIRHLNVLVSNHRGKGEEPLLPFLALKGLARLLITCLVEQEIYEDTFKILAQVAYHIAFEISLRQSIFWPDLLKFISSNAEKEFKKAAYVFISFSMVPSGGDDNHLLSLLDTLIPPILQWLQPSELSRRNNWSLAFASAFCAVIHLIEAEQVELVEYIVNEMLKSATELVNSGMEVGFVRRGVREVEMLVRKRLDWYSESDYEFVSDLIQRLDGIKGLKKETKMVLWRIHMAMEIQTRKRNKKKKLKVAKGSSKLVFLNPSGKDAAALISTLLQLLESQKKQSANVFYLFCWEYLQNGLAEMIFNVYQCSIDAPENRSKSISLLCALLTHFEENDVNLSRLAIRKIKPLLISSLSLPVPRDSDVEILSKITYLVALDAFTSSNNGWDELCVCIYWMAMDDLRKALYFFRDLPPVYEDFLFAMVERIFPEILTRLNQERGDAKDWSLALQTAFKMAMQLLESSRMDLADNIQYAMVMWASKLVRQEKQQILQQGLEELRWIVEEYTKQYKYDANQHKFALGLASMMARMAGAGMEIKAVAREIYQILKSKNP